MIDKKATIIVEQLAKLLISVNKKLAVAESCTGGWIAKILTDMSGSSTWFERGFVTYSNQAKHEMLNVSNETLTTYGAVSKETVIEMAEGALNNSQADFSLSVSGVAGPSGGSVEKPVGLVWFSWAVGKEGKKKVFSEQQNFQGDRNSVREQAVLYALTELIHFIKRDDKQTD